MSGPLSGQDRTPTDGTKAGGLIAVKKAALAVRRDDFNASPPEAAHGLLGVEHAWLDGGSVWECACGDGALVRPFRAAGLDVLASDLVERGCPDAISGIDFLFPNPPFTADAIVTNPPFKLAQAFIDAALERAPYVAMLLPLRFLEGQERGPWFPSTPLAAVHVFSGRLPMMHREGYEGPKLDKGAIAFAWFVWDQRRAHERRIGWISDEDIARGFALAGGVS